MTTIVSVRRNGQVVVGGDGQVSLGNTVMKGNARKVRRLYNGKVLAGFAGGTADALVLQAVADVDAGGADLDAQAAVDAAAQAQGGRVGLLGARAARITSFLVVGDDHRVLVEHRALETGVRTHVGADLLAQEAGVAPQGKGVEEEPEPLPRTQLHADDLGRQVADGGEVADEGEAGEERQQHPQQVLGAAHAELVPGHRGGIKLATLGAVAFQLGLDPHEDLGVDRLRTGVAAPDPPGHGRDEEEGEGTEDQQARQIDEVLRPEHGPEEVELAGVQVEEDGLTAVPLQPGQPVEDQLGDDHCGNTEIVVATTHRAGLDLDPRRVAGEQPPFLASLVGCSLSRRCLGFACAGRRAAAMDLDDAGFGFHGISSSSGWTATSRKQPAHRSVPW